ncbi:MAG TPA: hypothetical protein VF268_16705 [Gammaproteobacteria bacterium]
MTEQQALDVYTLTESIHAYWGAFGAAGVEVEILKFPPADLDVVFFISPCAVSTR